MLYKNIDIILLQITEHSELDCNWYKKSDKLYIYYLNKFELILEKIQLRKFLKHINFGKRHFYSLSFSYKPVIIILTLYDSVF